MRLFGIVQVIHADSCDRVEVAEIQASQKSLSDEAKTYFDLLLEATKGDDASQQALKASACVIEPVGGLVPQEFVTQWLSSMNHTDQQRNETVIAQQIRQSLWSGELIKRHEAIPQAYAKTFDWIFEPPEREDANHQWANFSQWLEGPEDFYWIAGGLSSP